MTPILLAYGYAFTGLIALWVYILTRYKMTDMIDAEDLVEGILLWIFGPIGLLIAFSYWGDKIGWKIKLYKKVK